MTHAYRCAAQQLPYKAVSWMSTHSKRYHILTLKGQASTVPVTLQLSCDSKASHDWSQTLLHLRHVRWTEQTMLSPPPHHIGATCSALPPRQDTGEEEVSPNYTHPGGGTGLQNAALQTDFSPKEAVYAFNTAQKKDYGQSQFGRIMKDRPCTHTCSEDRKLFSGT